MGPLKDGLMQRGSTWSYVIRAVDPSRVGAVRVGWVASRRRRTPKQRRDLRETGGVHGTGLSPRTVDYVHAVLRKAFNDAVRVDQILTSNPADRAKRPRRTAPAPRECWTREQLLAFLESAESHRLYPFFRLAAYSGAHRGELLNLPWSDVDLKGATIRIRARRPSSRASESRGPPKADESGW